MGLKADLSAKLDVTSAVSLFQGGLSTAGTDLGGIDVAVDAGALAQVGEGTAALDTSGFLGTLDRVREELLPKLADLPVAEDIFGPIDSTLTLVEALTQSDLSTDLEALLGAMKEELERPRTEGFLPLLLNALSALRSAPQGGALITALSRLVSAGGFDAARELGPLAELGAAAGSTLQAVGGLMALETELAESERLAGVLRNQLDASVIDPEVAELTRMVEGEGVSLRDRVATLDPTDLDAVRALTASVRATGAQVGATVRALREGFGLGEATLVYWNLPAVEKAVERATADLRTADVDPIHRVLSWLEEKLAPVFGAELGGLPVQSLGDLLDALEAKVGELVATVEGADLSALADPVTEALSQVTELSETLSSALSELTVAVRAALEPIKSLAEELPLRAFADEVRSFLDPVRAAMQSIGDLVGDVGAAIQTAAENAGQVTDTAEAAVDAFQSTVESAFRDAKDFLDEVNLEAVVGGVAGQVQELAKLLAQAEMKPYFDTAKDAISGAADVIDAVPFDLLPDSIEADVEDAVRPIKETDARAVQAKIESLLGIGPDGKFALRPELDAAVADVQTLYDALIEELQRFDVMLIAAEIETQLSELAEQIRSLVPEVALEPVAEALDRLHGLVESLDLRAALQPLEDAFGEILAAIDRYSPAALLEPLEARIDDVREKLVGAIRLSEWGPRFDEIVTKAKELLEVVELDGLDDQIERAFAEARALTENLPDFDPLDGLGTMFASFLSGGGRRVQPIAFSSVIGWMRGAPDAGARALEARARNAADGVAEALARVQALDPEVLLASLALDLSAVKSAVAGLPQTSDELLELHGLSASLDLATPLGWIAANRERYIAALEAAHTSTETLKRTGLSEADDGIARLHAAVAPLRALGEPVTSLLSRAGVPGLSGGLRGILTGILDEASPERMTTVLEPVLVALRARMEELIDTLAQPLREAITNMEQAVAAFDLGPLREELTAIQDEVKGQIGALAPSAVLGDVLDEYDALRTEVLDFDPLGDVQAALETLQEGSARVLEKLDAERLLAIPKEIYDDIVAALATLDLESLLAPLFDQLDGLATQVDEGLEDTVTAFEELQEALP